MTHPAVEAPFLPARLRRDARAGASPADLAFPGLRGRQDR